MRKCTEGRADGLYRFILKLVLLLSAVYTEQCTELNVTDLTRRSVYEPKSRTRRLFTEQKVTITDQF